MCQHMKFRSLKRSIDTSGIGKQGSMTHINVVSRRRNDKGKEEKRNRWPTRGSNSIVYQYLTKGLHEEKNKS